MGRKESNQTNKMAWSSLPSKKLVRLTDRPAMTIAIDFGRITTKQNVPPIGTSFSFEILMESHRKYKNSHLMIMP